MDWLRRAARRAHVRDAPSLGFARVAGTTPGSGVVVFHHDPAMMQTVAVAITTDGVEGRWRFVKDSGESAAGAMATTRTRGRDQPRALRRFSKHSRFFSDVP